MIFGALLSPLGQEGHLEDGEGMACKAMHHKASWPAKSR